MGINTQRFDRWIKKHKLFAMAAPLVLLLLVFFIVTSLKSMDAKDVQNIESGYNNSLPNQKNELEVEEPNTYYKQSVKDSLDRLRAGGKIKNIIDSKKEKDSLEKILMELENFSLDDELQNPDIVSFTIDDKICNPLLPGNWMNSPRRKINFNIGTYDFKQGTIVWHGAKIIPPHKLKNHLRILHRTLSSKHLFTKTNLFYLGIG